MSLGKLDDSGSPTIVHEAPVCYWIRLQSVNQYGKEAYGGAPFISSGIHWCTFSDLASSPPVLLEIGRRL